MRTAALLDELSVAVHRDAARRRARRRLAAIVVVLAALAVGGVGVAGTVDDWWGVVAGENASVGIDLDLSTRTTVAQSDDATLTAVATNGGKGYCLSLAVGSKQMGTSCTTVADSEFRTRADAARWLAYGRILDRGAEALDLSRVGLPARVPLARGGFFLLEIPPGRWSSVDARHGDVAILDADGRTLRRACVWTGVAPGSVIAGGGMLGAPGGCDVPTPVDPVPNLAAAERVAVAGDVALWRAPSKDGNGVCFFTGRPGSPQPVVGLGAGSCRSDEGATARDALFVTRGDDVVSGEIGSAIVRVTLAGDGRTFDAAVGKGAFVARLPGDGPYEVTGYGRAGEVVRAVHLAPVGSGLGR